MSEFCDMVDLNKSHDCKECRNAYTKEYYKANKQRIRDNERLRRVRHKESLKTFKIDWSKIDYHAKESNLTPIEDED